MTENLSCVVHQFLAHKRTLGRRYVSEEAELELLVRFADKHHVDRPFPLPPFNPCVRFSRTRLSDDLLGVVTRLSGSGWCPAGGAGRDR
jgi:hypothetical protein